MKKTLLPLAIASAFVSFSQVSGNMPTEPVNGQVLGYTFDWNGRQSDNCEAAYTDFFGAAGYTTSVQNNGLMFQSNGTQTPFNYALFQFTEFEGTDCDFAFVDMTNVNNRRIKVTLNSSIAVPQFLVAVFDNTKKGNFSNPAIVALSAGDNDFVVTMPESGYENGFDFTKVSGIALIVRNAFDNGNISANILIDKVLVGNAIPTTNFANNGNAFGSGFFKFGFEGNALENCVGEAIGVVEGGRGSWRGNGYTYGVSDGSLTINTLGNQEYYSGPEFHFFGSNCTDRKSIDLSNNDNKAISLKVNMSAPAQLVIQMLDDQGRFASNNPVVIELTEGDNIVNREFIPAMKEFNGSDLNASKIVGFMLVLRNGESETAPKPTVTAKFDYIEVADITTGLVSKTYNKANVNPNPAKGFVNVDNNSTIRFFHQ
ncbi:MAG: hypothetical protein SNJ77_11185, partial [Cytophagales bacterium]